MEGNEAGSSKQQRRVARALVATYHGAELAGLVEHVAAAIERYRAGEIDVHEVDEVIHQYKKAARELWKFCFMGGSGAYAGSVAATAGAHDRGGRSARLVGSWGAAGWLAEVGWGSRWSWSRAAALSSSTHLGGS